MSYDKLIQRNPMTMSQKERAKHLDDLWTERKRLQTSVTPSVNQLNNEIELTQFAMASATSTRLAWLSLTISAVAVLIAVAGTLA